MNQIESYAYTDTEETRLGRDFQDERSRHPEESGFFLLGNGLDAFVARAVLAHAAERSIDAQYYLLHDDLTGRLFIDQLLKAADRGVRVRLLVDDMGLVGRDLSAAILDAHPSFEVRIFNPFSRNVGRTSQFVTRFGSVTRRMHNKSFTVDNQATVLGGRNIGNEYFHADPDLDFGDLDVLGIGPVARTVSQSFDRYWNHSLAYPVSTLVADVPAEQQAAQGRRKLEAFVAEQADTPYLKALGDSSLANRLRDGELRFNWGSAQVVADHPEKLVADRDEIGYHLGPDLAPYFEALQDELIIFSPYFVPGKEGVAFFKALRERGVRVRILTNSLASTDVTVVHAGYVRYRKKLLRAGVELYEMNKKLDRKLQEKSSAPTGSSKASLHAKSFVLDRQRAFIGSLNLDPRSLVENSEIGAVVNSPEIASEMAKWFDENIDSLAFKVELERNGDGRERLRWSGLEDGAPRVFGVEPYTGFWRRFGVSLMRLFPIESQL